MEPVADKVILIDGDTIKAITDRDEWESSDTKQSYEVYDLNGRYVMPGLINMHVHLAGNGKPQKKQRDNAALVGKIMSTALTRRIAYNMVKGFAKLELLVREEGSEVLERYAVAYESRVTSVYFGYFYQREVLFAFFRGTDYAFYHITGFQAEQFDL